LRCSVGCIRSAAYGRVSRTHANGAPAFTPLPARLALAVRHIVRTMALTDSSRIAKRPPPVRQPNPAPIAKIVCSPSVKTLQAIRRWEAVDGAPPCARSRPLDPPCSSGMTRWPRPLSGRALHSSRLRPISTARSRRSGINTPSPSLSGGCGRTFPTFCGGCRRRFGQVTVPHNRGAIDRRVVSERVKCIAHYRCFPSKRKPSCDGSSWERR
jgi:hypothetical protein